MILRALCLLLALALPASAQTLPEPMTDTLSDYAGLIAPEDATRLSEALRALRAETGVHVAVAVMGRTADHGGTGARIDDYAKALFNQWGIGNPALNDGILILVARDDREVRIALGAGYDVIWDNAAQRVIDRFMLPAFREDRYTAGIEGGITATYDLIARPHAAGNPPPEPESNAVEVTTSVTFFIIFFGVATVILRSALGDWLARFKRCENCGARALRRKRVVIHKASQTAQGLGKMHTTCTQCKHDTVQTFPIAKASRGSSSRGGGFGGGSSSGGGATGRW